MSSRSLAALAAAATILTVPSAASAAEALYGVTADNRLVLVNSSGPSNPLRDQVISGLPAGEKIVGLDTRPATEQLYALGSSSRLYVVNPATGAARAIGAGPFSPALTGTRFGFDFNPTVDRLRVVSDEEQNLRLQPDTGAVAATDTPLAYKAGDANAGQNPTAEAAGYTNSVSGATSTELFVLDTARDVLALADPPNAGTLSTRGALGLDAQGPAALDIATDGTAYASFRVPGGQTATLHTVNLSSGTATPVAGTRSGLGRDIVALAAAGQLAADRTPADVSISLSSAQLESKLLAENLDFGVACDESCVVEARLVRGGRTLDRGSGSISGAGKRLVEIPLGEVAKAVIRRPGDALFDVRVAVTDAAGNAFSDTRQFRTRIG